MFERKKDDKKKKREIIEFKTGIVFADQVTAIGTVFVKNKKYCFNVHVPSLVFTSELFTGKETAEIARKNVIDICAKSI